MKIRILTVSLLFLTSCSYISGPEGLFPPTRDDFLKERIDQDIQLPADLNLFLVENHYPVNESKELIDNQDVPRPRQIFASSGNSSVQLRRLGELMWIYVETLPSTSWPISKSFWDTSSYEVLEMDPVTGEMLINFDKTGFALPCIFPSSHRYSLRGYLDVWISAPCALCSFGQLVFLKLHECFVLVSRGHLV